MSQPTWRSYCQTIGDRAPLFAAIREAWDPDVALYPGSYVDLSPSTAIPSVTYVDTDRRAARFFGDADLVASELSGRALPEAGADVTFIHQDYSTPLPLETSSFDLLISLYAGPVWDNCREYLTPQGLLLANASHGDASLAALDPGLRLIAAVQHRAGVYRLIREGLGDYLVPKRPEAADPQTIRDRGRGIAYTKSAFAYIFQLV
ncbi:MAG TPA: class I SAM-dependent methyltransferase [Candidatus Nanopelagicales bacterium]|nr:class I SAM-dependent methyltransferase [Candidatus Nanopelagicales bacterium]